MIEFEGPDRYSMEQEIATLVASQREHYRKGETSLIPKKADVLACDERFWPYLQKYMLWEGSVTLTGEGFEAANHVLGRRTVFFEESVDVDGTKYYLEIKGYGRNGRELRPNKHSEGDLSFGMFMDGAEKEHSIPLRLREKGVMNVQLPVALLKFDEADFIDYTREELEKLLDVRMQSYFFPGVTRIREAARRLVPQAAVYRDEDYEQDAVRKVLASKMADVVVDTYKTGKKPALRKLAGESGLEEELSGLTDERQAGYVIRAVRSPLRVGDLHDPKIVTDGNRAIAQRMGRTVRQMLELGFLHMTPNPGNWNTAGELVDFEDVVRYPKDKKLIEEDMQRRNIRSIPDYLEFIFAGGTIGYLADDFQSGFVGRSLTSTHEVVHEALEVLELLEIGEYYPHR